MSEDSKLIEKIKTEDESYSDDSLYNITSFGTDITLRELVTMYKEGDLERPELQRKYVWTRNEASRFIDSILLGLPVPSIFLAKTQNEKRLIVDGFQRIMTVYDYIEGIFSGDSKVFKLTNSENINAKWRGKAFTELAEEQKRIIRYYPIHAIIFEQRHPQDDTGMYQIFERINTSGRALKPQEIRNCVYHGEFNKLLFELNKLPLWRTILNEKTEDSRMADIELILRFFAIGDIKNRDEIHQKQINLVKYLNNYMGDYTNLDIQQQERFSKKFKEAIGFLWERVGCSIFRNAKFIDDLTPIFAKRINPVIFDAVCTATIYVQEKNNYMNIDIDNLYDKYIRLLKDTEFSLAIKQRTTNIENIKIRISKATEYLYGVDYEW